VIVDPADEYRHTALRQPHWEESWSFELWLDDGSLGAAVRLALRPHEGRAWYWAHLVGSRRPVVAVRDHDVPLPRGRPLEVRSEGLWAEVVCETPLDHWSMGLEAFGVALDDPTEAYRGERGDRVALGLDLEWEAASPALPLISGEDGYEQASVVHGQVLVGAERIDVDGRGRREHVWGTRDWWGGRWCRLTGALDGGCRFGTFAASQPPGTARVSDQDGRPAADPGAPLPFELDPDAGPGLDGLVRRGTARLGDSRLDIAPLAHAPVLVEGDGGRASLLARALCRYELNERGGWGWAEWLQPAGG
jgi:hypothetical protein